MKAARFGVATAAVLAVCGFALTHADARAADDLRQRAEDLARAASERFDAFLRPQHVAQVQDRKISSDRTDRRDASGGGADAWSLAGDWLERSGREYQGLMQRLAQAGDAKSQAAPAKKEAAEVKPQTAPAAKKSDAPTDWLTYSSERFQWLMRRLSERAAPPDAVAEAERRRILQMQSQPKKDGDEAGKTKLLPGPTDKVVSSEGSKTTETTKTDEERRLAETRRAEAAKRAEEVRKTEEALKIEQARKIADAKKIDEAAQKADQAKKDADARKTEETKAAEEAKRAADALKAKQAEESAKEQARKAADAKKLDEAAKAEQALKAAQAKQAEDAAKAELARKAAEAKQAEDARKAEAAKTEQLKKAADAKKAEDEERKRVEERRLAKEKADEDKNRAAELASRLAEEKRLAEQTARALDHVAASKLAKGFAERTTEPIRKEDLKEGDFKQTEVAKTDPAKKAETVKTAEAAKQAETKKAAEPESNKSQKRVALATTPKHTRGQRASRTCEAAGQDVALGNWYVVKAGDTLWDIAQRHYQAGWRYKRIFASNRRTISNPHWIMPCQRLYIPALSRKA